MSVRVCIDFCAATVQQADNNVGMGKVRGAPLRSSGVEVASITFYHLISRRRGGPVSSGGIIDRIQDSIYHFTFAIDIPPV